LMGSGMAFPWTLIRSVNLASGNIVEDLKLGLELARLRVPATFCPYATVTSQFPSSKSGKESQRKRWEQGHVALIGTAIPRLIYEGIREGNLGLLALAFDAAVPPLALLAMLLIVASALSFVAALFGWSLLPLTVSGASVIAYGIAVLLAWWSFGRDILPTSSFPSVASYVAGKLPLYRQILARLGHSQWVRTERDKANNGMGR
jgi:cellulose synthase/poly-beta-1,6-N-acetylglucosamine synthase-like glycosyltransferase